MQLPDDNAFMDANRLYHAFDLAPGFWTWLSDSSLNVKVGSMDAVKDEITAGTGDLVTWAGALPASFGVDDTRDVVAAMAQLQPGPTIHLGSTASRRSMGSWHRRT